MKGGWIASVLRLVSGLSLGAGLASTALVISILLLGAVPSGAAWAQSRDELWQRCASSSIDLDVAIAACTTIIQSGGESDAHLAAAFTNRAADELDERDQDRALSDLSRALQLDPGYVAALKLRADIYGGGLHRYDLAAADFARAIAVNPNDGDAYSGRCLAYYSENQYESAIRDCDQAIRINPKDAKAYYVRGLARQATGDSYGGGTDIERARLLNPNLGR